MRGLHAIPLLALSAALATSAAAQLGNFEIQDVKAPDQPRSDKMGNFEIQDVRAPDRPQADKMGNFEIQDVKSPRDTASGQANGFEEIVFTAKDQPQGGESSSFVDSVRTAREATGAGAGTSGSNSPAATALAAPATAQTADKMGNFEIQDVKAPPKPSNAFEEIKVTYTEVKNGGAPADAASTNRTAPNGTDGFMIEMGTTPPGMARGGDSQGFIGDTIEGTNIRTKGGLVSENGAQAPETPKFIGETEKNLNGGDATNTPKPGTMAKKQRQKAAKVRRNQSGN